MSAPIYTPFFIHPNQKKRIPRKRNVVPIPPEEAYPSVPVSMYDTRSRRQTAAAGVDWPPDSIPISSASSAASSSATGSVYYHQTSLKRSRAGGGSSGLSLEEPPATTIVKSSKMNESDGPHDVAAEVEVNVEDDVGDIDTAPRRPDNNASTSPPRTVTQFASASGESSASGSGHHPHHHSRPLPQHHHVVHHRQPTAVGGPTPTVVVQPKQFDPDSCKDVGELRHRLYAAYDRIEQLSRANMCINRLKHDNAVMKTELNKCSYRISQLESVVLERNLRLKQLLSENVLMSARMKRIQSEFGVDAVKEIFSRDRE